MRAIQIDENKVFSKFLILGANTKVQEVAYNSKSINFSIKYVLPKLLIIIKAIKIAKKK